jgi:F0F1-type ATP synthase assembly protein I
MRKSRDYIGPFMTAGLTLGVAAGVLSGQYEKTIPAGMVFGLVADTARFALVKKRAAKLSEENKTPEER